jgi:hypothetical protein
MQNDEPPQLPADQKQERRKQTMTKKLSLEALDDSTKKKSALQQNIQKTTSTKKQEGSKIILKMNPDTNEYVRTMADFLGVSMTDFINGILASHMADNEAKYQKAQEYAQFQSDIKKQMGM